MAHSGIVFLFRAGAAHAQSAHLYATSLTKIPEWEVSFSGEYGVCVYLRVGGCELGSPHRPLLAEQVRYSPNTL
jgi:hypothetical protein